MYDNDNLLMDITSDNKFKQFNSETSKISLVCFEPKKKKEDFPVRN